MEKISRETPDLTQENIAKIAALFPDVVTEATDADGNVRFAIDFDALRDDLSGEVVDGPRERYQFTWPGKRGAKLEARRPTKKTMRPCPEKSKDWETTENLYIEGDNLEALKIMRETYAGKIKLIYIDPPYNTGHDFVYDDDFSQTRGEYDAQSGDYDEEGGRLVANPESNGRFHSDWCSMMYPRLLLARDLLSDDGAIFISIDDGESANLEKMMDEIMGKGSQIAVFEVVNNLKGRNDKINYAPCHEHLVAYGKSSFISKGLPLSDEKAEEYNLTDENGEKYQLRDLRKRGNGDRREDRPNMFFPIYFDEATGICSLEHSEGLIEITPRRGDQSDGRWRWGFDTVAENLNMLHPKKKRDGSWGMEYRVYLNQALNPTTSESEMRREKPKSVWFGPEFSTDIAQRELKGLFEEKTPFDFPKPCALIKQVIRMTCASGDIVLDFFSGSATTAQAVMQARIEDELDISFIMIQFPEDLDESLERVSKEKKPTVINAIAVCNQLKSEHSLAIVGEERIRRAGEKIKAEIDKDNKQLELGAEPKPVPDIGFRVLRVDESCLKDEYAAPDQYDQAQLDLFADNAAEGAAPLDLLFQVLPAFRIEYSAKITERELGGKTCFDVNDGQLISCFDEDVDTVALEAIAKERPLYAVFRDACFSNDAAVANLEELFKTFSPDTIRKVI